MPVPNEDKPLDLLREETIDRLIVNYGHGHLSMEAFQRRLDQAFDAADAAALTALTADLDDQVDAPYLERKQTQFGQFIPAGEDKDSERVITILGGNDRRGAWTVPRQLDIVTVLGGTDLDMSEARFASSTTRINVFCLFGGIDIKVPEGVNTTMNVSCILGGADTNAPSSGDPNSPVLVIDGFVIFGGLDVKLHRTLRERVVAFADQLRSLLGGQAPR
jgi:hypothetical protein